MHKIKSATVYKGDESNKINLNKELKSRKEIEVFRGELLGTHSADHVYFDYDTYDFNKF